MSEADVCRFRDRRLRLTRCPQGGFVDRGGGERTHAAEDVAVDRPERVPVEEAEEAPGSKIAVWRMIEPPLPPARPRTAARRGRAASSRRQPQQAVRLEGLDPPEVDGVADAEPAGVAAAAPRPGPPTSRSSGPRRRHSRSASTSPVSRRCAGSARTPPPAERRPRRRASRPGATPPRAAVRGRAGEGSSDQRVSRTRGPRSRAPGRWPRGPAAAPRTRSARADRRRPSRCAARRPARDRRRA